MYANILAIDFGRFNSVLCWCDQVGQNASAADSAA
jgi:hypothetical protein